MAITFNESTVTTEPIGVGVGRQRLLTEARVPNSRIRLDRLSFAAHSVAPVEVASGGVAWLQVLDGELRLDRAADGRSDALTDSNVVFLPPGFRGTLAAAGKAHVLYAEVPSASQMDPGLCDAGLGVRIIDWRREPVLDSQHDARRRIYLVTPKLFGTTAVKGEMIIYPPGTEAANHHHEGAEHFMYLISGSGTAHANEEPFRVQAGDVVWFADRERHYFISDGKKGEDMVFAEFFAPGEYKTVWAPGASVCTWVATGKDIAGNAPVRQIASHSSADKKSQADV
jgi:quercetin dioxygenase-like cupin family protein